MTEKLNQLQSMLGAQGQTLIPPEMCGLRKNFAFNKPKSVKKIDLRGQITGEFGAHKRK